jgi:Cu/Ag efflux pump CusA
MGRATLGGMFASTLLTLFIVPVAYTLLDDVQKRMGILLKKRKPQ